MRLIERSLGMMKDAIQLLDLIVFLPLKSEDDIVMSDSEDPELRRAVNSRLAGIYNDDDFNLFASHGPVVLEAMGSTAQRLRMLEKALGGQLAENEAG